MLEAEVLEHTFSVEMKSKRYVKSISISDEAHDRVLFEGNLGKLLELYFAEEGVLEFVGVNGVLRVAVAEKQLRKTLKTASQVEPQLQGGELYKYQEICEVEKKNER